MTILSGMMSLRQDGAQMPRIIRKFLGTGTYQVYNIFLCFLMLLVGAVFHLHAPVTCSRDRLSAFRASMCGPG